MSHILKELASHNSIRLPNSTVSEKWLCTLCKHVYYIRLNHPRCKTCPMCGK